MLTTMVVTLRCCVSVLDFLARSSDTACDVLTTRSLRENLNDLRSAQIKRKLRAVIRNMGMMYMTRKNMLIL